MGFPIAEVIGAAATVGANAYNVGAASKTNLKTRQHNEHMFAWQLEEARKDWDRQNAYNDPSAVMGRLKKAGLNPAIVYGQGSTGSNASPVNQPGMASWNPDSPKVDAEGIGESMGKLGAGMMSLQKSILQQNLENARRTGELIREQTRKTSGEAEGQSITNIASADHLGLVDELGQPVHRKKYLAEYSGTATAAHLKAGELANQKEQIRLDNLLKQSQIDVNNASESEKRKIVEKMIQEIANLKYDGDVKKLHSDLAKAGINPTAGPTTDWWQSVRKFFKFLSD